VPSFTDSKDMIGGQNLKNGSCDPDHAPFMDGLSSESYDLIISTCVRNLVTLASDVPEI